MYSKPAITLSHCRTLQTHLVQKGHSHSFHSGCSCLLELIQTYVVLHKLLGAIKLGKWNKSIFGPETQMSMALTALLDMLQSYLYTELCVHNIRGDMLQAAAVAVDLHSEGQLQLTALL